VTETDIPFQYADENLMMNVLMKIQLQKIYTPGQFTFNMMKKEYGIYAVREPVGVPAGLVRHYRQKAKNKL